MVYMVEQLKLYYHYKHQQFEYGERVSERESGAFHFLTDKSNIVWR